MSSYLFAKLKVANPLGAWCRMKMAELRLKHEVVTHDLGLGSNALSVLFQENSQGPSFATRTGGALMETIIDEERNQWRDMWAPVPYPSARPRTLRQAAFTTSLWNAPRKSEMNLEFFELMTMVSDDVIDETSRILCEPMFGLIKPDQARKPRQLPAGGVRAHHSISLIPWHRQRASFTQDLIEASKHPDRDDLFDAKFDELVDKGELAAAVTRARSRYEAMREIEAAV